MKWSCGPNVTKVFPQPGDKVRFCSFGSFPRFPKTFSMSVFQAMLSSVNCQWFRWSNLCCRWFFRDYLHCLHRLSRDGNLLLSHKIQQNLDDGIFGQANERQCDVLPTLLFMYVTCRKNLNFPFEIFFSEKWCWKFVNSLENSQIWFKVSSKFKQSFKLADNKIFVKGIIWSS